MAEVADATEGITVGIDLADGLSASVIAAVEIFNQPLATEVLSLSDVEFMRTVRVTSIIVHERFHVIDYPQEGWVRIYEHIDTFPSASGAHRWRRYTFWHRPMLAGEGNG